jgi:uncharacterized protein with PIN domain
MSILRTILGAIRTYLGYMKNYPIICKRYNSHESDKKDVEEFLKNEELLRYTRCINCNARLKLITKSKDADILILS